MIGDTSTLNYLKNILINTINEMNLDFPCYFYLGEGNVEDVLSMWVDWGKEISLILIFKVYVVGERVIIFLATLKLYFGVLDLIKNVIYGKPYY